MWLPKPIYERIPHFWFLLGLLFIATGLYLGFEFTQAFWYIAIGSFCCAYSAALIVLRFSDRPRAKPATEPQTQLEYVSGEPDQEVEYVSGEPDQEEFEHRESAPAE